jgi:hypothetical protein
VKAQPLLAIFLFASVCQAETAWTITDGNSLSQGIKMLRRWEAHESLTHDERINTLITVAYLRGFLDSSIRWSEVDADSPFKLPQHGIPRTQFIQVVEKFLTDNPQILHLPSGGLLLEALVKNFPNLTLKKD